MNRTWTLRYVEHVIRETGLSPSALAERADLSSTTLTRPLNSPAHPHDISRRTVEKIQEATGIPFAPFIPSPDGATAHDPADEVGHLEGAGKALVSVYDVEASAGHGAVIDGEMVVERLAFPPGYLNRITRTHPRHLAIIGVKGDSMEPDLKDDDVVMIDRSKTSLDYDGLFVLRFGDALHVKRVGRAAKGMVRIISDNSRIYPAIELPREEVEVIGKVIWMGKKV